MKDKESTAARPFLNRKIALNTSEMPCPACRRGECEQPSGRYIVTATYEAVVIAHSHEEALAIADDAKYDHRVESMRMVHPDTADVRWPDA